MEPTIRTARPADLDAPPAHPEVLVRPGDGTATGRTRVALDGGTPVGFATTVPAGDAVGLDDLFVDPDRMRPGSARALLADALAGPGRTRFGPAVRMWPAR